MDIDKIKAKLSSEVYEEPYEVIEEIIKEDHIPDELFEYILALEDTLVLAEFLYKYLYLTDTQVKKLKNFIKSGLAISNNEVFKSDLIEIAAYRSYREIIKECYKIIDENQEEDIVVLSAINYLFETSYIIELEEIKTIFDKVITNTNYYQNCQTAACFFLYRITLNPKYLKLLKSLVTIDDINKAVVKNLLKEHYNKPEYFFFRNKLEDLLLK